MKTVKIRINEKEFVFKMSKKCKIMFDGDGWAYVSGSAADCGKIIRRLMSVGYNSNWKTLSGRNIVPTFRNGRTYKVEFYWPETATYYTSRVA